jgi:DNA repair protein RecO (recombination protein O)
VTERLKLRAVVLRVVDHGEADRVVTLLARGHGRLAGFARGARASRKRFGGGLEPGTLVSAELSGRGGADRLLRLESVSPERAFHRVRGDLARIACAAYAVELARELIRDHEAHDDLFDLLVAYLTALDEAPAAPALLRAFELAALAATGFQPRLDACARCGAPLPADQVTFSPADGGTLCATCALQTSPGRLVLSAAAVAALRALQAGGLAAGAAPLEPVAGRESREALERFLTHLLGHRLQARKFLDEVGPLLSG